jgi:hypothetical protein
VLGMLLFLMRLYAYCKLVVVFSDVLKDIRLMGIDDQQWDEVVMGTIQTFAVELQKPEVVIDCFFII